VHIVVNNQVGFTTSPSASRSSLYCTDIARMIAAPIFHVNGDDPEACVRVARLAVDYRREFKKDVVIDMVCYRRRGHNEADNPSFTQPLMYDIIDGKRSVRKLYTEALVGRGDISLEDAEAALKDFQAQLEKVFVETRNATGRPTPQPEMDDAAPMHPESTATTIEVIKRIAAGSRWPAPATSTGPPRSCSPSGRWCSTDARSGWPGRTRAGAPSRSATPCSSTAEPVRSTRR
jgi:2-oxoglutarate dehydrogenase E1 component